MGHADLILQAARRTSGAVNQVAGWEARGHGPLRRLGGVVWHDTVTPPTWTTSSLIRLLVNGRPEDDLPGPIANIALERDGSLWLVAAGRAWHAGPGSWPGLASANSDAVGIEAANGGSPERWTDRQVTVATEFSAALADLAGFSTDLVIGHAEWAPRRKIDPWSVDMADIRATLRRHTPTPAPPPPKGAPPMTAEQAIRRLAKAHGLDVGRVVDPEDVAKVLDAEEGWKYAMSRAVGHRHWGRVFGKGDHAEALRLAEGR